MVPSTAMSVAVLCAATLVPQVIAGAAAVERDTSWYGSTRHGAEFVNVRDFGARGDGVTDDTRSIQRAINHHRLQADIGPAPTARPYAPPRRAIVYLPPGTYVVSDTVVLWFFTHLRGSTVDPPTLLLRARSLGFGDAAALKPVLATAGGCNQSVPWWRDGFHANDMFYNQVHSVRLSVAAGNGGAVGLYWSIAQQTSLRDVTIEGARIGIDVAVTEGYRTPMQSSAGLGGGGTIEDVAILGGDIGMRCAGSQYTMRGLTFRGQRTAAVQVSGDVWVFAFATVVASDMPTFMIVLPGAEEGWKGTDNNVLLLDIALTNITGGSAVTLPADGIPLVLENVTLHGDTRPAAIVTAGSNVWLGAAEAHVARWAGWRGQGTPANFSNGVWVANKPHAPRGSLPSARTAALPSQPRPWFDDVFGPAGPCNAMTQCGATGDNVTDDTTALQRCVHRCANVFLPSGIYRLTDTLKLNASTVLVGEGLAQLYLAPRSPGFQDATRTKPVLDTPDDADGAVQLTDISVQAGYGNTGATLVRWRVGRASGMWDVHINISHNVHVGLHVTGSGAGVISNMWGWGADHSQWLGEHMREDAADIGFLGDSQGPLWAFGVAFEHHRRQMFSLRGASNYVFLALQTEQAWWLPTDEAAETVHLELGAGTSNITIYGGLHCDWQPRSQAADRMVDVAGVGDHASIFGLRTIGGRYAVNQPGVETMPRNAWLAVVADVDIKP